MAGTPVRISKKKGRAFEIRLVGTVSLSKCGRNGTGKGFTERYFAIETKENIG